jgi:hypothetical protein
VLGRSGWQKYTVSDLIKNFPAERLAELKIDTSVPSASIDLYRPAEEVFAQQTILSAEGKPFTDGHPPEFVTPDNFRKYARGHVQHVHKGDAALDSGDWPLEGDIVISDAETISKVDGGTREISLGYIYDIARSGEKILQVGFIINHAALVPQGRAGSEARIYDSAPAAELDEATLRQVEAAAWEPGSAPEIKKPVPITTVKEKVKVSNRLMDLIGRGLKALAADEKTTPEELAEAAASAHKAKTRDEESEEEKKKREGAEDSRKRADDAKRMKDEAESESKEKEKKDKEATDKKAKDAAESEAAEKKRKDDEKTAEDAKRGAKDAACKPGEAGHTDCTDGKCVAKDRGAKDSDGGDHRSRMHASLDKMLDEHEENNGPMEGEEADLEELKELMGKILSEVQDPDGSDDGSQMLEPVGEVENETMANDAADAILAAIERSPERKTLQRAFDEASLDTPFEFLKAIKPAIAKSKDAKVRRAFDAQVQKHRTSRPASGGYAAFGMAAGAHDSARINDAARAAGLDSNGRPMRDNSKMQAIYDDYRNGKTPVKK